MDQTTLGIGTRLQHTHYGPGVIVGIRYATYLISFINHGIKEIDKTDEKLDEIIPENITAEIETHSDVEKSLLKILRLAGRNKELRVVNDQIGAPTTAAMVAEETVRVLTRYGDSVGLYHLTASGEASWYTFAQAIVRGAGLSTPVVPISSAEYPAAARRPAYSKLDSTRFIRDFDGALPSWEAGLAATLDNLRGQT